MAAMLDSNSTTQSPNGRCAHPGLPALLQLHSLTDSTSGQQLRLSNPVHSWRLQSRDKQLCQTHMHPARADAALHVLLCARGCAGAALATVTTTSDALLHLINVVHSQVVRRPKGTAVLHTLPV